MILEQTYGNSEIRECLKHGHHIGSACPRCAESKTKHDAPNSSANALNPANDPSLVIDSHGITSKDLEARELVQVTKKWEWVPSGQDRPPAVPESQTQDECEQWLTLHRHVYLHLSCKAREKKGWPDLVFWVRGIPFAVELKNATGTLRKEQAEILQEMADDGVHVAVCRSSAAMIGFVNHVLNSTAF